MSTLPVARPKKMSDGQFIGDLTKLLERRKIKCGDPHSLENFGSELISNDILRSDLFTLCTAISHMADEDLPGEQLLVLVARAVGDPEVSNADGAVEIPDSMRSAFLTGYEAWSNRGTELNEPLPWPPPRKAPRSEPLPPPDDSETVSNPGGVEASVAGLHTIQEALDIARKRSPIDMESGRSFSAGPNIEGLTISELKKLLEEIEQRVSRIQPHLLELTSMVGSPGGEFRRRQRMDELDEPRTFRSAARAYDSVPLAGRPSLSFGSDPGDIWGAGSVHVSEDAFLARHPYMRPSRRPGLDISGTIPIAAPVAAAPAAVPIAAAAAATPTAAAVPVPLGVPVAAPADVAVVALSAAPVAVRETAANPATPLSAALPVIRGPADVGLNPIGVALIYALERFQITPGMVVAIAAVLLLVPSGFAVVLGYHYLHPAYSIRYSGPPPAVIQTPDLPPAPLARVVPVTPGTAPRAGSGSRGRPASDTGPILRSLPVHNGMSRGDASRQARPIGGQQQPQPTTWPPPPRNAGSGETPAPTGPMVAAATSASSVSAAAHAHPAASATGPLYVPSSTMIQYALSSPKPVYPADRAKGMDGTVVLQITISKQGDVTSTRTVSGPAELSSAAVEAVRTWRFTPYLLNGDPVDVVTTLEVPFKPQQPATIDGDTP